jgi:hypothetical protein
MALAKTARAAPERSGSDPQILEQLPGRLDFEFTFSALELQTKKIAKRFGLSDTMATAIAGLAFPGRETTR